MSNSSNIDLGELTINESLVANAAVKCLRLWERVRQADGGKLRESGGKCSVVVNLLDDDIKLSISKSVNDGMAFVETVATQGETN